MQNQHKGATPIEKNVIVVDEQGNEYEATYPKRAKGLVKNGRARFVDENKICLACPPNENLEDKKMTENIAKTTEAAVVGENVSKTLSIDYVLAQIGKIVENTAYIEAALGSLASVESACTGDIGAQEKAKGIADVVKCRETTNQQLIGFYERVYNDLKNEKAVAKIDPTVRQQFLDFVKDTTTDCDCSQSLPDFDRLWNTVFLGK